MGQSRASLSKVGSMGEVPASERVTVVLTSCRRFDLLERGLRSFFAHNTYPIERFLLMEDSGDETAREIAHAIAPSIEVHIASPPRGQIASIDYAYSMVETPYIFHSEEDYVFHRGGFIEESLKVLKADDRISMVSGRGAADMGHQFDPEQLSVIQIGGIDIQMPPRAGHPSWHGYAFHAGLRRKREWEDFGPFTPFIREWDVSYAMKRAGLRMAYLVPPAFVDIDEGISTGGGDPTRPRGLRKYGYKIRKSLKRYRFSAERRLGRYDD